MTTIVDLFGLYFLYKILIRVADKLEEKDADDDEDEEGC